MSFVRFQDSKSELFKILFELFLILFVDLSKKKN